MSCDMTVCAPRSNNPNHENPFDGEPVPIGDFRLAREAVAIAAIHEYAERFGRPPTGEAWAAAGMRPSEKTIRRRFGSFRAAILAAGLAERDGSNVLSESVSPG